MPNATVGPRTRRSHAPASRRVYQPHAFATDRRVASQCAAFWRRYETGAKNHTRGDARPRRPGPGLRHSWPLGLLCRLQMRAFDRGQRRSMAGRRAPVRPGAAFCLQSLRPPTPMSGRTSIGIDPEKKRSHARGGARSRKFGGIVPKRSGTILKLSPADSVSLS